MRIHSIFPSGPWKWQTFLSGRCVYWGREVLCDCFGVSLRVCFVVNIWVHSEFVMHGNNDCGARWSCFPWSRGVGPDDWSFLIGTCIQIHRLNQAINALVELLWRALLQRRDFPQRFSDWGYFFCFTSGVGRLTTNFSYQRWRCFEYLYVNMAYRLDLIRNLCGHSTIMSLW